MPETRPALRRYSRVGFVMQPTRSGEWVRYTDVQALEAERARLRGERAYCRGYTDGIEARDSGLKPDVMKDFAIWRQTQEGRDDERRTDTL